MTLQELKLQIQNRQVDLSHIIIFKLSDIDFIPLQYIDNIRNILNCDIEHIDSIEELCDFSVDIFGSSDSDNLKLLFVDEFNSDVSALKNKTKTFVITKKIKDSTKEIFNDCIVEVPKLDVWQIKDFVYSVGEGVDRKDLDNLMLICKNDIFRLDKELKKLSIFDAQMRQTIFNQFIRDNIFNDLSNHTIFDMSNAILKKNYSALRSLYKEIDNIDCEPLGLLTILYNNFRNIILVQLGNNPTAESCGMTAKQFWAVKYSCGSYSKDQLYKIFNFLTDVDRKIKTGELPVDILVDYLITYIMTV